MKTGPPPPRATCREVAPSTRAVRALPWLLLLLAQLAFLVRVRFMDDGRYVLYDDAFISFRYARNLAGGEGLVFNPGERVEGYTNMLWTCLLAGAMALGGDPILAAKVLGVVSGVIVLALSALLTHRLSPGGGLWVTVPGLLLSATASLPRHALSGMETVSFSACLLLALWIEAGSDTLRNRFLAGLALGLATLTRPEGLLFFACLSMGSIADDAGGQGRGHRRLRPPLDGARLPRHGMEGHGTILAGGRVIAGRCLPRVAPVRPRAGDPDPASHQVSISPDLSSTRFPRPSGTS